MLYMVLERFKDRNGAAVYKRFRESGRMMETESRALFDEWMVNWEDLMTFEIIPVITSQEAREQSSR
jgi:hypothetical protein